MLINIDNTKEPVLNYTGPKTGLSFSVQSVEVINRFKYVGKHCDKELHFAANADYINKKVSQRLFLMRKLRGFGVSEYVLERVNVSLIEIVLMFNTQSGVVA